LCCCHACCHRPLFVWWLCCAMSGCEWHNTKVHAYSLWGMWLVQEWVRGLITLMTTVAIPTIAGVLVTVRNLVIW
jgi:hypothetical protein